MDGIGDLLEFQGGVGMVFLSAGEFLGTARLLPVEGRGFNLLKKSVEDDLLLLSLCFSSSAILASLRNNLLEIPYGGGKFLDDGQSFIPKTGFINLT